MSANLVITANVEGQYRVGMIPRITRGITHSSQISRGDFIDLPGGVTVEVKKITHGWEPTNSERAPGSVAFSIVEDDFEITAEQWKALLDAGMTESSVNIR